jgi:DNA-binding NtrC family response regulator
MFLTATKKVHTSQEVQENISILLVSSHAEDASAVRQILRNGAWRISIVPSVEDARQWLQTNEASVVLCERELADSNWRDVLALTQELPLPPMVVVTCRHADEDLWSDVLNSGGYDVLAKPFDKAEVTRVLGMAWRHVSASRKRSHGSALPAMSFQFA